MNNFIDENFTIDFHVSKDILYMMKLCEKADAENNYGEYMNYAEFLLYTLCKEAYRQGHITKKQWEIFERRYRL